MPIDTRPWKANMPAKAQRPYRRRSPLAPFPQMPPVGLSQPTLIMPAISAGYSTHPPRQAQYAEPAQQAHSTHPRPPLTAEQRHAAMEEAKRVAARAADVLQPFYAAVANVGAPPASQTMGVAQTTDASQDGGYDAYDANGGPSAGVLARGLRRHVKPVGTVTAQPQATVAASCVTTATAAVTAQPRGSTVMAGAFTAQSQAALVAAKPQDAIAAAQAQIAAAQAVVASQPLMPTASVLPHAAVAAQAAQAVVAQPQAAVVAAQSPGAAIVAAQAAIAAAWPQATVVSAKPLGLPPPQRAAVAAVATSRECAGATACPAAVLSACVAASASSTARQPNSEAEGGTFGNLCSAAAFAANTTTQYQVVGITNATVAQPV